MKDLAIAIRNYTKQNYKEVINAIKIAGFKNVFIEWYNKDEKLQQDILNYVRKNELNIVFAHLGYQNPNSIWELGSDGDKEIDRYIKDIEICKSNGIDIVVIHPTLHLDNPGMTEIGINRIKRLVAHAEKINVKIAFENVELPEYLKYIIENIQSENLGVCFDAGHANVFSNKQFDTKLYKNKVFVIHLHDNYKLQDDHNMPFDGNVDWNLVVKQIKELNYNEYVILECGYQKLYENLSLQEYYNLAYARGVYLRKVLENK